MLHLLQSCLTQMPLIGATASVSGAIKLTPVDRKLDAIFQMLDAASEQKPRKSKSANS